MVKWFWQRRDTGRKLQLRSRDELSGGNRVDFEELAPDIAPVLPQAVCTSSEMKSPPYFFVISCTRLK